ncbi:MAG: pyruvate:ferredoxin (flavodoxin) oxidoreductase, partial [Bifidobacteriaceae bacterium]|nr:pyruvate:ferredoxin (flavodoxin) oxidoreductase [Bifidobacteriaceae bacterium]
MVNKKESMDGNTAAAHISYAFTQVASIYPITPSSTMAELVDEWAAKAKKNLFDEVVKVKEMQSEAGAAGAVHGSLKSGALTTTYTASQGLLLMIPNMYKIAGELLPCVFHVSARAIATNALSIFGDHSDIMAVRQTGFAMLGENSVQEVMDLSAVAHLASLESSVPFVNFFDGFRTSHEIQKIDVLDYDDLRPLINKEKLTEFRARSVSSERPTVTGTNENPDLYFQQRETVNANYLEVPKIVKKYMQEINKIRGTNYDLVNYYGAPDAEEIIIIMGSGAQAVEQTIDYLNKNGRKTGMLTIHLYRPFPSQDLLEKCPKTVKNIAVLDRTKEPGSQGEPLLLDVQSAFFGQANTPRIIGGRFGIGSKDFTPDQVVTIYDELAKSKPKNNFTVGINDDITNTSLEQSQILDLTDSNTIQCKFWGFGSDGTVGANKSAIKIIGNNTDKYVQGYFAYDSKKSGGLTVSHLRFGGNPIKSTYLINSPDFVSVSLPSYVRKYDVVKGLKKGGTFLLNCIWTDEELDDKLPNRLKKYIAENDIQFYTINALELAREVGLGGRTNTAMQTAFFKLSNIIDFTKALELLKDDAKKSYAKKSMAIVEKNWAAIEGTVDIIHKVDYPSNWKNLALDQLDSFAIPNTPGIDNKQYIEEILTPISQQNGDNLSVGDLIKNGMKDGTLPLGTSASEKRGVSAFVPEWIPENCIGCNECSFVCPHAAIRPILVDSKELKTAPEGFITKEMRGSDGLHYRIQVSVHDCTGCGLCIQSCPAKEKALKAAKYESQLEQARNWAFAMTLKEKTSPVKIDTVKGSQFVKPLLEFSGACAGCGETPYVKLLTQLFGDRMIIANATGCSSIWGGPMPAIPFTTNQAGHGPAWSNSLFEDNAEFGLGIAVAGKYRRDELIAKTRDYLGADDMTACADALAGVQMDQDLKTALAQWADNAYISENSRQRAENLKKQLQTHKSKLPILTELWQNKELLAKPSQWIIGGDGWGYDIGYAGIDHVIASGEDVNILVMDNEVYSNTGGQASKATPTAAIAKFAAAGKTQGKKDLGAMAMTYGGVYVAQIASGANAQQTIKAFKEAEAYQGPSLIIAYTPCINHGLKGGMFMSLDEAKEAVESGYWSLYRYNPDNAELSKPAMTLDYKKPDFSIMKDFMLKQNRFS